MIGNNIQEAREDSGLFSFGSLRTFWEGAIDLIFPPRCQHCGRVDAQFCQNCQHDLASFSLDINYTDLPPMKAVVSGALHTGLMQAGVQALKYNRQRQLGAIFAQHLANVLESTKWQFDTIIPVPLHTAGLKKRGYNQAKEISIHLANLRNSQHNDKILIRQNQTQSQVGLNQEERINNVKEAFQVSSRELEGATVLLVDDVRTTGSTLIACTEVLLASGVKEVYGITVTAAGRFQ